MTTVINITGAQDVINSNNAIMNSMKGGDFDKPILNKIVELAKKYSPFKTGQTERSIHIKKVGNGLYQIIATTPWSPYMEYGTRFFPKSNPAGGIPSNPVRYRSSSGKIAYQPYMRYALWEIKNTIEKDILNQILYIWSK
jgi:hypothetical protein